MAALLVSGKQNTSQATQSRDTNKQGGLSNKGSSGEKVLHATSQVVSRTKTKLEGNGWVETMNNETNTSKPKYGENDYLYSP